MLLIKFNSLKVERSGNMNSPELPPPPPTTGGVSMVTGNVFPAEEDLLSAVCSCCCLVDCIPASFPDCSAMFALESPDACF